jgi:hypothetical protein
MFRSLILAAVLLASAPLVANAGEITLLPSVKLQIGDRDNYGNYWDGGGWRDRDYWRRHYEWRDNRWRHHDNGWHRGWDKRKAYERGYREGWNDRDDRRGGWGRGGWGRGRRRSRPRSWPSLIKRGARWLPFFMAIDMITARRSCRPVANH